MTKKDLWIRKETYHRDGLMFYSSKETCLYEKRPIKYDKSGMNSRKETYQIDVMTFYTSKETCAYEKRPVKHVQRDLLRCISLAGSWISTANASKETCTYEKRPIKLVERDLYVQKRPKKWVDRDLYLQKEACIVKRDQCVRKETYQTDILKNRRLKQTCRKRPINRYRANVSKETCIYKKYKKRPLKEPCGNEKRPVYAQKDLYASNETIMFKERPIKYVKRDKKTPLKQNVLSFYTAKAICIQKRRPDIPQKRPDGLKETYYVQKDLLLRK